MDPKYLKALEITKLAIETVKDMMPHDGLSGEDLDSASWEDRVYETPEIDLQVLKLAVVEVFAEISENRGFSCLERPTKGLVHRIERRLESL